jgi:hypothetical protein
MTLGKERGKGGKRGEGVGKRGEGVGVGAYQSNPLPPFHLVESYRVLETCARYRN